MHGPISIQLIWIWFLAAHSCFLRGRWVAPVLLRTLSFGFGITLENPRFITYYDMFENIFVIFYAFKKVQAQGPSVFLLFVSEDFWDQLCTCSFPQSEYRGRFGDSNSTHFWSFWISNVDRTSREPSVWSHIRPFLTCKVVFHSLTVTQKWFMPPKNLCPRQSKLSIRPL